MTIDEDTVAELAQLLLNAELTGRPIGPLAGTIPAGDIDSAYLVQSFTIRRKLDEGRRIIGRKIGLTNPKVQVQLGVDQPDFGVLLDNMQFGNGAVVPHGHVLQPRVEGELALVVGADLASLEMSRADVAAVVDVVRPAIEIVGSRIADWQIEIVDTVADNASSGAFVLGSDSVPIAQVDLVGCEMTMSRSRGGRTEVVSHGTGADCLGNPLAAAHWLAIELARRGDPLRQGDIVLTGALGPMVTVEPGDSFHVTITGVGTVAVSFEATSD